MFKRSWVLLILSNLIICFLFLTACAGETGFSYDFEKTVTTDDSSWSTASGEEIDPGMFVFRLEPHFAGEEASLSAQIEQEIFSGHRPGDAENLSVTLYGDDGRYDFQNLC